MFGTRENFHDDQEEDQEQDSTGFESSYDSENSMKDPFEFPSHYGFAKTENSNNEVKHSPGVSGFSDSHWDNFFTGHADTIEKDIHSLSKQPDDHTAPPDDYNDEQAEENDEEEGNLLKGIGKKTVFNIPMYNFLQKYFLNGKHTWPKLFEKKWILFQVEIRKKKLLIKSRSVKQT